MSGYALILAAHGSNTDSNMNEMVCRYADIIREKNLFDEVIATFLSGEPTIATVLDHVQAAIVTVVPMMTSEGYYNEVVLPRELIQNQRIDEVDIRCTAPVGTHPMIVSLVQGRVSELLQAYHLNPQETSLAIIGHGTARHKKSRMSTFQLANGLKETQICGDVITAFLEDQPEVETVKDRAVHNTILVEPFFIGDGLHTKQDIPRRLGIDGHRSKVPPFLEIVGDSRIIIDSAIGTDNRMVDVILDLAMNQDFAHQEALT